jgi:glycosyltransferase involved in cell wall biosynthesis
VPAELPAVDVLMSTYNGHQFLPEQIHSILDQHAARLRLLVRDDASTDHTRTLLQQYAELHPSQIELLADREHLGACASFGRLLLAAKAPYVMFSDQDDVWLPGKVALLLCRMLRAEAEHGRNCPLLVHSDLCVVDRAGRLLGNSFWKYQNIDPIGGSSLNRLLIQNVATGCAMMVNRALVELAVPIPPEAIMHDWWLALVAAAFGRIECLAEPTVLYRQHGGNQIGAVRWDAAHLVRKAAKLFDRRPVTENMRRTAAQANALLQRYGPLLSQQQREAVAAFAALPSGGFLQRRLYIARYGFLRTGWIRNLALLARV